MREGRRERRDGQRRRERRRNYSRLRDQSTGGDFPLISRQLQHRKGEEQGRTTKRLSSSKRPGGKTEEKGSLKAAV